jgi:hypothetical protein
MAVRVFRAPNPPSEPALFEKSEEELYSDDEKRISMKRNL